jgi:acetyl-CoA carboxylase carboxyltransferase component
LHSTIDFFGYRGGILEPEGTVEIKFRLKDLSKTMHRLDPVCVKLCEQLSASTTSSTDRVMIEQRLREREDRLLPIYHQVAVMFADLHDTAERMKEKGCIVVSLLFLFILAFKC